MVVAIPAAGLLAVMLVNQLIRQLRFWDISKAPAPLQSFKAGALEVTLAQVSKETDKTLKQQGETLQRQQEELAQLGNAVVLLVAKIGKLARQISEPKKGKLKP